MKRLILPLGIIGLLTVAGCDDSTPGDAGPDAGVRDAAGQTCRVDSDCDDGVFCNGAETCTSSNVCAAATNPCDATLVCNEDADACEPDDCETPDADGDGDNRIACGGADCDDNDAARSSMAAEVCAGDGATVDEDCDPSTLSAEGEFDDDNDGFVAARCQNTRGDGSINTGRDCNDERADVHPDATESCNTIDDNCDGETDEAGAFCPAGMCLSSRCRSVPWERTFAAADDNPVFGMTIDADGTVFLGLNLDSPADLNHDGTTETFGAYIIAVEADGRFRFVQSVASTGGVGLAAVPGESDHLALATRDDISLFSTIDGSPAGTLSPTVPGSMFESIVGLAAIDQGLVVAISFRDPGTLTRLELVVLDLEAEVARTRLADPEGRYEFFGLHAQGDHIVVRGNTGVPLHLAGEPVNGHHVVVLSPSLEPRLAIPVFADVAAIAEDGALAVGGTFNSTFSPPWTETTWTATGTSDAFISVFSHDGTHRYTRIHGGDGFAGIRGLTFDGRDTLFEAGHFGDRLPLPPRGTLGPSDTGSDAYFAQVDANEDFTLYAQGLSGGNGEDVVAVQADPFGALVVAGTFGRLGITLPSGTTYLGEERNNVFLIRISNF